MFALVQVCTWNEGANGSNLKGSSSRQLVPEGAMFSLEYGAAVCAGMCCSLCRTAGLKGGCSLCVIEHDLVAAVFVHCVVFVLCAWHGWG